MYCLSVEETRISSAFACAAIRDVEDDVAAEEVVRARDHEAGVQADAQLGAGGVGLAVAAERPLELDRGVQAAVGTVEGGEESIALEL